MHRDSKARFRSLRLISDIVQANHIYVIGSCFFLGLVISDKQTASAVRRKRAF